MSNDPKLPPDTTPRTHDQIIAELLRENERLRRQVTDVQIQRDQYKEFYLGELAEHDVELTPQDIVNAVPALPLLDRAIERLERKS